MKPNSLSNLAVILCKRTYFPNTPIDFNFRIKARKES